MARLGRGFPARPLIRRILPAGGSTTSTLAVGTASFALTGQSVSLRAARVLPLGAASFALTGQTIGLHRALVMPVGQASFALSGQAVALRASRRLPLANASFALSGQSVALRGARRLALANASFVLNGQVVRLAASRRLSLANASFTLTGENVTLTKVGASGIKTLIVDAAHFSLSGQSVGLRALRRLALSPALGNEGAWTPLDFSGAGLVLDGLADACRFVMINGLVHAFFAVVLPATVNTAPAAIGGLPALARDTGVPVGPVSFSYITVHDITGIVANGASMFNFYHTDGTPATNADLSGAVLRGCAIYEAAS
jgi:hypothetical protein